MIEEPLKIKLWARVRKLYRGSEAGYSGCRYGHRNSVIGLVFDPTYRRHRCRPRHAGGLALRQPECKPRILSAVALQSLSANVDHRVGDLTRDTMTLEFRSDRREFRKAGRAGSAADQAAGLINMILETIGVMAILAVRQDTTRTIVLTGALAVPPQAKPLYDRMSQSIT